MNLAKRAKLLQAHNLRCQGQTYREMGAEMNCAPSTAARYLREFERHREEIIQQLAQDQLIGLLQQLPETADDLHQRHVNAAREFRLLLNALDQMEDRRQKRERRIYENDVQDAKEHFQGLEEIVENMFKSGYWEPTEDLEEIGAPVFGPATQTGALSRPPPLGEVPRRGGGGPPKASNKLQQPARTQNKEHPKRNKIEQNRTRQNRTETKSPQFKPRRGQNEKNPGPHPRNSRRNPSSLRQPGLDASPTSRIRPSTRATSGQWTRTTPERGGSSATANESTSPTAEHGHHDARSRATLRPIQASSTRTYL